MAEYLELKKLGRNDPCVCGSGKKYKKCCLNKNTHSENEKVTFMKRVKKQYGDKEVIIVEGEETDILKMSEVILEYVDELLDLLRKLQFR